MTQVDSDDEITIVSEILDAKPVASGVIQENVENKKQTSRKLRDKPRKEKDKGFCFENLRFIFCWLFFIFCRRFTIADGY